MKKFADISEYYTGDLAVHEENEWIKVGHKHFLDFVNPIIEAYEIMKVVEYGCATGHVAFGMPPHIDYVGVDRNNWFLEKARERCQERIFMNCDIRDTKFTGYDLSMAWGFIKHFGLHEIDEIIDIVISSARYSVLGMQFLAHPADLDDGTAYHHSWISEERFAGVIDRAGYKETSRQLFSTFMHPLNIHAYDCAVLLERK
jgi:hypothetical protein